MMPLTNGFFCCYRRIIRRSRLCSTLNLVLFLLCLATFCSVYLLAIPNRSHDDADVYQLLNVHQQKEFIDKRGVHVIIGQYIGPNVQSDSFTNLTEELLNTNSYKPIAGLGEQGLPVYISELEAPKAKALFQINKFNLVASDKISINRSLPDSRKQSCRKLVYDLTLLPNTSIIIVFHNEAWSTLLRTIHSVLNRSPRKLLFEIILVDDASERSFLKSPLDEYLKKLQTEFHVPIHLIRSSVRVGLVKARLLGVRQARGEVLTFLDAHIETTEGWLEPLLQRILEEPESIVCPIIDIIHEQTFAYTRSFDLHWGGINWNLHFRWFAMGETQYRQNRRTNLEYLLQQIHAGFFGDKDKHKKISHRSESLNDGLVMPFKSPIMAGGLFSVRHDYFERLGLYDEHMRIWGGENVELSLRVWSCGGRVEIHPCSHVAHLFRKSSPYSFPGGVSSVLYTNLARLVQVWMEPRYRLFFHLMNPLLRRSLLGELHLQSDPLLLLKRGQLLQLTQLFDNRTLIETRLPQIEQRLELQKRLKCNSFEYFLDHVWPQHFFPSGKRFFGQLKVGHASRCVQRPSTELGRGVGPLQLTPCQHQAFATQLFVHSESGAMMTDESLCVDVQKNGNELKGAKLLLLPCSERERQQWSLEEDQFKHSSSGLCARESASRLVLSKCDNSINTRIIPVPATWWLWAKEQDLRTV